MEIEYLTETASERASAAEYVSVLKPSGKQKIVGLWNVEGLAVHFLLKLEMRGDSCGYGMSGRYVPNNSLLISSPHEITGSTENRLKGLRMMS